ncbi:hypothetical protein [Pelagibaculum spongiae]|uniref:Uncharacterized protein n=1 Tax=Pelagibaculum spongiae TaxID=2080658 RepID=A0A2V1H2W1_9GAMM|nr:hypothetical protein [Pelagibaculum spongiae]PVZ71558.1 hypothetical protein DC094_00505 [Pelagibaculum spongiae]
MKSFLLLCTAALFIVACGQADHSVDPDEISAIDDAAEMQESVNAYQASGLSSDGTGGSSFYGDWRDGAIAVSSRDGWGTPWNIQRWMSGYGLHYRNNPFNIIARHGPLGRSEHVLRQRAYLFEEENGVRYAIIPHGTKRYLVYPSGLEYRAGVQYLAMVEIPYRVLDDTKLKKLMTFGWETDLAVPADIEDSFIYNGEVYTVTQNGNIYKIKKFNPQGPSEDKYVGLELDESAGEVQITLHRGIYNSRSVVFADDEIIGRLNPADVMLEVFENIRREISAGWRITYYGTQMEKSGLTLAQSGHVFDLFGENRNRTNAFALASSPEVEIDIAYNGSSFFSSGGYYRSTLSLGSGGLDLNGRTEDIIVTYEIPLNTGPEELKCRESLGIWGVDFGNFGNGPDIRGFRYFDTIEKANMVAEQVNRLGNIAVYSGSAFFPASAIVIPLGVASYKIEIIPLGFNPFIYNLPAEVDAIGACEFYLEVDEDGIKSILAQGLYNPEVHSTYNGKFMFNGVRYVQTDGIIYKVNASGVYDSAGPRIELYSYPNHRIPFAGGRFFSPDFETTASLLDGSDYNVQYDETYGWYDQYVSEYIRINSGDMTEIFNDIFN